MTTPKKRKFTIRSIALILTIAAGLYLLPAKTHLVNFQPYNRDIIKTARDTGRPVLIKFTAEWCSNCKVVERTVFNKKDVADLIKQKNVLAVLADTTTKDSPATADLDNIYGQSGNIPLTVIIMPDGKKHNLLGMYSKNELIKILTPLPKHPNTE